jgi:hypothetical protein
MIRLTPIGKRPRTRPLARLPVVGLSVALLVVGNAAAASARNQWPTTVVAGATTPANTAEWVAQANGTVTAYGRGFYGDARREPLAKPIAGMAATATGKGYWLVAADGGVFSYGHAHFHGSMGATHLNQPVIGIASTADGRGYWLAAADGGIFTFGDAHFFGSLGGIHLDQPIVGISATRSGKGYRLVARDGGVFTFGDATYRGSLGGTGLTDAVGLAPTPSGNGYWILRKLGGTYQTYQNCTHLPCGPESIAGPSVSNFGDARNLPGPNFVTAGFMGHPVYDYDFVGNPVVAIVANPVAQGYLILRAHRGTYGFAGAIPSPQ